MMGFKLRAKEDGSNRILVFAALGVLLLALVYFFFLKGDAQAPEPQAAAPIAQAEDQDDPFEESSAPEPKAAVETYEVFASRDPFEPVVENGSAGKGIDPDKADAGEPGFMTESDEAQAGQEVEGHTVTLVDVFRQGGKEQAQVEVDADGYTVTTGEVFADNFQLVSISGKCATLLYGDDQFTMCEGEEILK